MVSAAGAGPGRAAGAAGAPALPEPREGGPACKEPAALGTALEDGYEGLRRWGSPPGSLPAPLPPSRLPAEPRRSPARRLWADGARFQRQPFFVFLCCLVSLSLVNKDFCFLCRPVPWWRLAWPSQQLDLQVCGCVQRLLQRQCTATPGTGHCREPIMKNMAVVKQKIKFLQFFMSKKILIPYFNP